MATAIQMQSRSPQSTCIGLDISHTEIGSFVTKSYTCKMGLKFVKLPRKSGELTGLGRAWGGDKGRGLASPQLFHIILK